MLDGEIPTFNSLLSNIPWLIVSKALLISSKTTAVTFFSSIALKRVSVVRIKEVSVECNFLLPLSRVDNLSFDTRWGIIWLSATLSHTFERMGKREIGLLLLGSSWFPSFRIGDYNFQDRGKFPCLKEALIMDVITGRVAGRLSLITRTGMLSIPDDLLAGIDLTIWATS